MTLYCLNQFYRSTVDVKIMSGDLDASFCWYFCRLGQGPRVLWLDARLWSSSRGRDPTCDRDTRLVPGTSIYNGHYKTYDSPHRFAARCRYSIVPVICLRDF